MGHVLMYTCVCVCVCVGMCVRVCVCALSALQLVWVPSLEASSSDSEGGGGSRVTRRDRSFVVYVWSKGTHSCIHPFVYFLRREGGGFPSRMLTRWVSVKDDQGGTSNSRSFLSIRATVSPIRLVLVGHLRNMWVSSPRTPCWWQYSQCLCWYSCRTFRPEKCR